MAYIVVGVWFVFHHPTELVLSSALSSGRLQEVERGAVRRTSFSLPTMRNLHCFQSVHRMKQIVV
jgi:hypothetical protein